ncbi:MAG: phage baseplate protein [Pseudomonadota bacterium]
MSPILIECTISETHAIQNEVTNHPVQEGLNVTDFVRTGPIGLEIEAAFSEQPFCRPLNLDPNSVTRRVDGIFAGDGEARISAAWDAFLDLVQGSPRRRLLRIQTGLKLYENMILESVGTSQSVDNPLSIVVRARFVEARVVSSVKVTVPARFLAEGEAQERGQGTASQGDQQGPDVVVCDACDALCQECLRDNPAALTDEAAPEYVFDEVCAETQTSITNDRLRNATVVDATALAEELCPQIDPTQLMDRGIDTTVLEALRIARAG